MRNSARKGILIFGLVAILVLTNATLSSANNFFGETGQQGTCASGNPGGGNMADPNPFTMYYDDLAVMSSAFANTRINDIDPTDVDTVYEDPPTTNTDVVGYENNYGFYCGFDWDSDPILGNVIGLTNCVSLAPSDKCEKHEIRYDTPDVQAMTLNGRYMAACHEIGHALGLAHRKADQGCMQGHSTENHHYTTHDVNHLDSRY